MEYKIKLSSTYPKQFSAQNLVIKIPVPENAKIAKKVKMSAGSGKAKHEKEDDLVIWKFKKF